jgi:hypothetical protein
MTNNTSSSCENTNEKRGTPKEPLKYGIEGKRSEKELIFKIILGNIPGITDYKLCLQRSSLT